MTPIAPIGFMLAVAAVIFVALAIGIAWIVVEVRKNRDQ